MNDPFLEELARKLHGKVETSTGERDLFDVLVDKAKASGVSDPVGWAVESAFSGPRGPMGDYPSVRAYLEELEVDIGENGIHTLQDYIERLVLLTRSYKTLHYKKREWLVRAIMVRITEEWYRWASSISAKQTSTRLRGELLGGKRPAKLKRQIEAHFDKLRELTASLAPQGEAERILRSCEAEITTIISANEGLWNDSYNKRSVLYPAIKQTFELFEISHTSEDVKLILRYLPTPHPQK